jgi:hypothetical protein
MTLRLDDLRAQHPELGFAIYAMEPRGLVTLEIYTPDGQTYSFKAETEAGVINQAFPPTPEPVAMTPIEPKSISETPPHNVFE